MARTTQNSTAALVRATIQQLESLQQAGVTHLPKKPTRPVRKKATTAVVAQATPNEGVETAPVQGDPRAAELGQLAQRVAGCTLCDELARTRTQTVFGEGSPHARLAFLGEAPGADEDRTGRPFVGRAGQLLTRIIEACGLKREDVYIFNILKCRPPGNRTPLPSEAANCRQYLDRQLAIIRPEFICCLGAVAAQNLLGSDQTIGRLRGKVLEFQGIKVVCTYHPAYLLRNPDAKRFTWNDLKMLMAEMGLEIPKP